MGLKSCALNAVEREQRAHFDRLRPRSIAWPRAQLDSGARCWRAKRQVTLLMFPICVGICKADAGGGHD